MNYQPYKWMDPPRKPKKPRTIDTPIYYNIYRKEETEPRKPVIKRETVKQEDAVIRHLKLILDQFS